MPRESGVSSLMCMVCLVFKDCHAVMCNGLEIERGKRERGKWTQNLVVET